VDTEPPALIWGGQGGKANGATEPSSHEMRLREGQLAVCWTFTLFGSERKECQRNMII
jgi:hypothetical protein